AGDKTDEGCNQPVMEMYRGNSKKDGVNGEAFYRVGFRDRSGRTSAGDKTDEGCNQPVMEMYRGNSKKDGVNGEAFYR
ncbi:hypothetical protein CBL21_27060, partial [Shigella flexneri]